MAPRTLFEKVWQDHVVREAPGEPALLYIDLHLVHEVTSPQPFESLRLNGRQVRRTDLTIATADHNVATTDRSLPIEDPISAKQLEALDRNCEEFGLRLEGALSPLMGIVHVMQGDGLFPDMSVEDNLLMGAFPTSSWGARRTAVGRVYDLFPQLRDRRTQRARTLSGGERRLVALGRGLMRDARLLLIDEPSLGLAPVMIDTVYQAIREIRERLDTTVLLVEENFTHIGGIADVVHVIEMGGIVRSGSFEELASDRTVVETYLGTI